MSVYELLDNFADSIKNEIFHNVADDCLQDLLIEAVNHYRDDAFETYKASCK